MTASDTAKQQRHTLGLTIGLLMVATVGLVIACVAIAEEILTLPESRKEAAEITARLPVLRAERDSLINEIAMLKAELESQGTKAEQARAIAGELVGLQAEETRARAERDRLAKEVAALTSDQGTLQRTVDLLSEQIKNFKGEINNLVGRAGAERQRLDEVQQEVNEGRQILAQTKDALVAEKQKLAQTETDLADTTRLLDSKRAEFRGLTTEEQDIRAQVARLEGEKEELTAGNQREAKRLASLQDEIRTVRTTLSVTQGQLDQVRDELDRAQAVLETENARAETVSARLQRLTGLDAKVRQQIRTMIEELGEVERNQFGSETPR